MIAKATSSVVSVHVDPDVRGDVARQYLVEDLPAVLLIHPELGVLAHHENDYTNTVDEFLGLLDALPALVKEAESAAKNAEAEVARQPESGTALVSLANVFFRAMRLPEAEAAYRRALTHLDPNDSTLGEDVEVSLIYIRVIQGRHDDGIHLVDEFLARHPSSPFRDRALYYRGFLLMDSARLEEARAAFKSLLSQYPRSDWSREASQLLAALGG